MIPEIRKRKIEYSEELAHAIATVWNTTYKGIVDNEFLIGLLNSELEQFLIKYSKEKSQLIRALNIK